MISTPAQYEDVQSLILGHKLGAGIHRLVYEYRPDPAWVVKVACECPNINVLEEEVWSSIKEADMSKWFAPCGRISECGIFLLQRKVESLPIAQYPTHVPSFFGDLKYTNFGLYQGRFVCCDYASFIATSMCHKWSGRMKKADWWE